MLLCIIFSVQRKIKAALFLFVCLQTFTELLEIVEWIYLRYLLPIYYLMKTFICK